MSLINKRTAVFISNYSIGKSSPVICLLDCLLNCKHEVDLHIYKTYHLNTPIIHKITNIFDYSKYSNVFEVQKKTNKSYDYYITFDANGFVLCKTLYPDASPFYFSLELYFTYNHFNLPYHPMVQYIERKFINTIKGLIIQSEERERLFRSEYLLYDDIPTFLLPVGYLQPSCRNKTDFLRDKYTIPKDKKIALHIGGIHNYFCLIEIIDIFKSLKDWYLVLHGHYNPDYLEEIIAFIEKNGIYNVVVTCDYFNDIEELDIILSSADVGIAWYKELSPNFTAIANSSGKIASFLRFGLPIITNNYRGLINTIDNTGCGVCISHFHKIPNALQKIMNNYIFYSENCIRQYEQYYWFENYRQGLIEFIESDLKKNNYETCNLFLNPSPKDNIDIYLYNISVLNAIKQFIIANCKGTVLSISLKSYPYEPFLLYNQSIDKCEKVTISSQYKQFTYKDNTIDCVIAVDVFEHIPYIESMLSEINRVLKPGGMLFFTVPFLWPLHDMPNDEYRYTPFSLKRHLENAGFSDIKIEALGGWDASLAQMIGLWLMRKPMSPKERAEMINIFYPLYEMLIKNEELSKKPSFDDMLSNSIMITGLTGTALKSSRSFL